MKKKLLSPVELKELRLQQEEQRKLHAEEKQRKLRENLNKNSKRLTSPKDLLDPQPVVEPTIEIKEEPVVVEQPKEPIEVLHERLEQVASTIKEPKYYDEELAKLEVLIASKVGLDEVNFEPVNKKIQDLRQYISELPEVKYYDEDVEKLTERVDELQVSGSEIFQQHGENLKEIKKVIHQILEDIKKINYTFEIPSLLEDFKSSGILEVKDDIAATKETFYERVAELKKEISELPEVKYYDTELTELQERIESVQNSIPEVSEVKYYESDLKVLSSRIEEVRNEIPELPEVKYYEKEISSLTKALSEVEKSIPKITQKDIINLKLKVNTLEDKIPDDNKSEITSLNKSLDKITEAVIIMKSSLRNVSKTVNNIPENVDWTHEIDYLYKEIEKLKERPVSIKEDADPLLPLEQKFVTFEDLAKHYRTFINRIQQQLTSLGGGGEVNLRFLDDIDRTSIIDGRVLSYDAATKKFVFISPGAASSLWNETVGGDIYRNSSVGINTADPQVALDVVGDARISGILTVGTDTITVDSSLNRITIDAPGGNQIVIDGNDEIIRVGSGITIKGDTNQILIGSDTIDGDTGDADFAGIVTAPAFVGEFVGNLDKTLEYQSGTLSTITTAQGTKTLFYDGAGILTSIVGTGVYVSKEFTYDGGGNLISVNVL